MKAIVWDILPYIIIKEFDKLYGYLIRTSSFTGFHGISDPSIHFLYLFVY